MAKVPSQGTQLAREALREILGSATQPMNSRQVIDHATWRDLGLPDRAAAIQLATLYALEHKPFPLRRIYGASGFEYFNPDVVKLEYPEVGRPEVEQPKVPPPPPGFEHGPGGFEFNPVDFQPEAPPAAVAVPAGVKCITLTVGGVSIKIEIA